VSRERARVGRSTMVDVVVNGRPWRVTLERDEVSGRYFVGIKGRRRTFDVAWIDETTVSLIDADSSPRRVKEAGISARNGTELTVAIDGQLLSVSIGAQGRSTRPQSTPQRGPVGDGPFSVVSPMPGRVVRLLVSQGDRVASGQGVVVVEAMKMENELRAGKDGVVREVRNTPGDAVDAGAVLVIVE